MNLPMDRHMDANMLHWFQRLGRLGRCLGLRVYLVGGPVRDLILGHPLLDIDLTVEGDALSYARRLSEAEGGALSEHPEFEGATIIWPDGNRVDVTATRGETYCRPGALPQVAPADIIQDLGRRDFTINAMALSLHPDSFGQLLDPHGGHDHLQQGRLVALHERSFFDDPTRILRAARFCARLKLTPDPHTAAWLRQALEAGAMATVSAQRLLAELRYLLAEPNARRAVELLRDWGALQTLELDGPALTDRLQLLDRLTDAKRALDLPPDPSRRAVAALGLLLAPAQLQCWLSHWPVTVAEARAARQAAALAHCPPAILFSTSAESSTLYEALEGLSEAALIAGWAAGTEVMHANLQRFCSAIAGAEPDLGGEELIALGYRPGPLFKQALHAALVAKLDRGADRQGQLAAALRVLQSKQA